MILNILALSLQLVTSGVIVPTSMLSNFYQAIGNVLPATYAAKGYYTLIFGGVSITTEMVILLLISAVTLCLTLFKVILQKNIELPHELTNKGETVTD